MTRSIVTGLGGFIGSNLCDYLLSQGHEVIGIDNQSANNDRFHWNRNVKVCIEDITDYDVIRPIFEDVDHVFHLVQSPVSNSDIDNPINQSIRTVLVPPWFSNNQRAYVRRVVYSSTSSGYGGNPRQTLRHNLMIVSTHTLCPRRRETL